MGPTRPAAKLPHRVRHPLSALAYPGFVDSLPFGTSKEEGRRL